MDYRLTNIYPLKAKKIIKSWDLDVIHTHTEFGVGSFARLISKEYNIPLVHTYHTMYEEYIYYITKGYFDRASKKLVEYLTLFLCDKTIDELIKMASFKRITSLKKNNNETFDEIVEYIGKTFDIDLYKCYKIRKYNKILLRKLRKLEEADNVDTKLKVTDILNKQKIIKYFYVSLCRCENDYSLKKDIVKLAFTFPKEFLSSLYLYTIRKGFWLW